VATLAWHGQEGPRRLPHSREQVREAWAWNLRHGRARIDGRVSLSANLRAALIALALLLLIVLVIRGGVRAAL